MERIEQAALHMEGQTYTLPRPARHGDLFKANCEVVNGIVRSPLMGAEQGFVTDTGRFVDRKEGCRIARAANQLIQKTGGPDTLYTEDLW